MQAMLTHFHLLKILIVLPHYFIDSRTGGKTQSSYSLQKQIKEYPYNTFSFKGRFETLWIGSLSNNDSDGYGNIT